MEDITFSGSYEKNDVVFLLKILNGCIEEKSTELREAAIQSGTHYSEMLPVEYRPSIEYMELFYDSLKKNKRKLARLVQTLSERIMGCYGYDQPIVLVSLARAGTPIGILIKRYLQYAFRITVPHYSISIIRDRGIDKHAIHYILQHHPQGRLVFIDGWTGKGVIQATLTDACQQFNEEFGTSLDATLGVLSDPAHCTPLYATREDFLIPSACLNSTVSGLMSRTVLNSSLIGPEDFHGAKYYEELGGEDVSRMFIQTIVDEFPFLDPFPKTPFLPEPVLSPCKGQKDIMNIQQQFHIQNINLIKPGVGETTRVLLRRIPWRILVDSVENPSLTHILKLAEEKNVPVIPYQNMSYSCCGIIKPLDSSDV